MKKLKRKKEPRCKNCGMPKLAHTAINMNCCLFKAGEFVAVLKTQYKPKKEEHAGTFEP